MIYKFLIMLLLVFNLKELKAQHFLDIDTSLIQVALSSAIPLQPSNKGSDTIKGFISVKMDEIIQKPIIEISCDDAIHSSNHVNFYQDLTIRFKNGRKFAYKTVNNRPGDILLNINSTIHRKESKLIKLLLKNEIAEIWLIHYLDSFKTVTHHYPISSKEASYLNRAMKSFFEVAHIPGKEFIDTSLIHVEYGMPAKFDTLYQLSAIKYSFLPGLIYFSIDWPDTACILNGNDTIFYYFKDGSSLFFLNDVQPSEGLAYYRAGGAYGQFDKLNVLLNKNIDYLLLKKLGSENTNCILNLTDKQATDFRRALNELYNAGSH